MERIRGREGALVTVNSQLNPIMRIQRDGWLRLRLLNASVSRFYRLRLQEHTLYLIAVDGGALPSPEEREEILLAPGERVEVMIRGSRPEGSYDLVSLPYNRDAMLMTGRNTGTLSGPSRIATLLYEGQAEQTWNLPERLVGVDLLPEPSVRRSFQLGQGMGMGIMGAGMSFTINGRTFNPDRIDTRVGLNTVEEWEFINPTTMDHPMHIHTNPFQVIASDGTPIRAWRDVVPVPAGARVRVRIAFRDFTGSAMYHCHILDHEDLGMMGRLEIQV
jgi:FtsP/CotA-like multicopper oxidase with cupredoxin domain